MASSKKIPVVLSRNVTTPMMLYSIDVQLTGLTASGSAFSEKNFLKADGASTTFLVTDNGGGSFTIDGTTLGTPCGTSSTGDTL